MTPPSLLLRLPDGRTVAAGPEAVIGRSRVAEVRLEDPRISTVHAELSWRADGFVVLARGGRVVVDGAPVAEARVAPGTRLTLVPGVVLEVVEVRAADLPPVPPTSGRDARAFEPRAEGVAVYAGDDPAPLARVEGQAGALLAALLAADGPTPWADLAAALWPEEAALREARGPLRDGSWTAIDERRYRNRFDQLVASLRQQLAACCPERALSLRGGALELQLRPGDRVRSPCAPAGPPG